MLYYLLEKWAAKANLAIAVFGPVVFVPTGMSFLILIDCVVVFEILGPDR